MDPGGAELVEDPWTSPHTDPCETKDGRAISDINVYRSVTPNDTPDSSRSGISEPYSDLSDDPFFGVDFTSYMIRKQIPMPSPADKLHGPQVVESESWADSVDAEAYIKDFFGPSLHSTQYEDYISAPQLCFERPRDVGSLPDIPGRLKSNSISPFSAQPHSSQTTLQEYHSQPPHSRYALPEMAGPIMSYLHSPGNEMAIGEMVRQYPPNQVGEPTYGHHPDQAALEENDRVFNCDQSPRAFNQDYDFGQHKRTNPWRNCEKSSYRKKDLQVRSSYIYVTNIPEIAHWQSG